MYSRRMEVLLRAWLLMQFINVYICANPIPQTSRCELIIADSGTDICYWLIDTRQHANASQAECEGDGGTLAYIPNEGALTEITGFIGFRFTGGWDFVYLGYQMSARGEIVIQGTNIDHSWIEFDFNQPSSDYGSCIAIFTNTWKFHNADCSTEMYALCSTPYVIETTTDMSTASAAATPTTNATTTRPTTTSAMSTTTVTTHSCCNCHTTFIITEVNITEELQEQLDTLKKETEVDEENLSSTIRKKTSASDPRPSSAYVGYLGIGLLTAVFGGLFLLDLPRLLMSLKTKC